MFLLHRCKFYLCHPFNVYLKLVYFDRCLQADSWRVVSASDDRTIKVWNFETGERLVTLQHHSDGVTCLQFNSSKIVSGSYDKTVKLWDFGSV